MTKATIAPQLAHLALPVGQLQLHPRNPREGDVGAIVESLAAFGQQKPLVAQERSDGPHIIIAGNHLYRAACELGWPEVAAVVTAMDDLTAMRFLIADNRTQERGSTNQDQLAVLLAELAMQGALDATGYDGDDVDDLLKLMEAPMDLERLMERHGQPDESTFYPQLRVKMPPELWQRWLAATAAAPSADDLGRLTYLLDTAG